MFQSKTESKRPGILRQLIASAVICVALFSAFPLSTWMASRYDLAIRCATNLVLPVGLIWCAFFFAFIFFLRRKKIGSSILFVALFLLWGVAGNGRLTDRLTLATELADDPELIAQSVPFRTVVVFGGGAAMRSTGFEELTDDGERVFSAAQLWHAGQTQSIICTGNSETGESLAQVGEDLLVSVGVPVDSIYRIDGFNTVEETRSLRAFLNDPPAGFPDSGAVGLISSAFHMPRVMRLAKKQSIDAIPIPVSFKSGEPTPLLPYHFVPNAGALKTQTAMIKEWLAWAVGR